MLQLSMPSSLSYSVSRIQHRDYTEVLMSTAYLKVNGIDPRGHTIFKEIERVKQYFNKIKEVEEQSTVKPSITLNKQAAARIIHHSLVREEVSKSGQTNNEQAGNGSPDLAQREREARERFLLKRKLKTEGANTSPGTKSAPISPPSTPPIEVPIPPPSVPTDQDADMQQDSSAEEGEIDQDESSIHITELPRESTTATGNQRKKRKQKHGAEPSSKLSADRKAEKKARKKAKKEAKDAANTGGNAS